MRNTIKLFLVTFFIYQSISHKTKFSQDKDLSTFDIEESNVNKDMGELPNMKVNRDIDEIPVLSIIEIFQNYPEDKDDLAQKNDKDVKTNKK